MRVSHLIVLHEAKRDGLNDCLHESYITLFDSRDSLRNAFVCFISCTCFFAYEQSGALGSAFDAIMSLFYYIMCSAPQIEAGSDMGCCVENLL